MTDMRRVLSLASLAAAAFLAGCDDGLIRPPASAAPASVAIAPSLDLSQGGVNEAYLKVNQLSVKFLVGNEQRSAQTVPFDPNAAETVVSLQVPLSEAAETFTVQVDLLASNQKLFTGSGTAQLTSGRAKEVEIPIVPVVSAVTCAGSPFQIRVYQAPRRITAAALFASGDTVGGAIIGWSSSNPGVVTVNQSGDLMGLQDGSAQVTCSAQGLTGTRQVDVLAAVAAVQVSPALDTTIVGSSTTFAAAFRDSLAHPITTPRATTGSSSNNAVATVSAAGVATGVASGTATITATSGGASGSAVLLVLTQPAVTTLAATSVAATTATINGSVNPQGLATQAWFEWGTAADLGGASSTTPQSLGAGNTTQAISAQLGSLLANQTYYFRAVASSAGGTVRGAILSFTPTAPPTVRTISGTPLLSGATLSGGVNPQGLATAAWFEWSTSPSLAGAQRTPNQNLAAGRTEQPTSGSLGNLTPGATYYFRAAASNSAGTSYGDVMSLVANGPPVVTSLTPTGITGSQALLQATVNPNGPPTNAWFEWSVGRTFTTINSTAQQSVGSGTSPLSFSQALTGLQPSTTYIFRAAASNALGTTRGSGIIFTTGGAPIPTTGTATWTGGDIGYWLITGSVIPNGESTTAWIEWVDGYYDPNFTKPTSTAAFSVGSGYNSVPISAAVYYSTGCLLYRTVAQNGFGIRYGTIQRNGCIIIG